MDTRTIVIMTVVEKKEKGIVVRYTEQTYDILLYHKIPRTLTFVFETFT